MSSSTDVLSSQRKQYGNKPERNNDFRKQYGNKPETDNDLMKQYGNKPETDNDLRDRPFDLLGGPRIFCGA